MILHPCGLYIRRGHQSYDDARVIAEVYYDDTYRVGTFPRDIKTVVDIGAHIGAFLYKAHEQWPSAELLGVEAHPDNWALLSKNCGSFATLMDGAVVGNPAVPHRLLSMIGPHGRNTGGSSVAEGDQYQAGTTLDSVVDFTWPLFSPPEVLSRFDSVDLLKIDCEGCEWCVLESSALERCRYVVGEFHDRERWKEMVPKLADRWKIATWGEGQLGNFQLIKK